MKIQGNLLIKNTVLNFIGQAMPLIVAVAAVPFIIRGLGAERFGIFSLAFVVLGYFSIFDLGLGRATTKFVSEALGKGEAERIPTIVWTSLSVISMLGLLGGAILFALTPVLVGRILNVPANLIEEAKLVFHIASISILITLITATLSGVLEAYQRFDLINALKVPSNILSYLIPAIALFFGANLPVIVLLLVIKNVSFLFVYFLYCIKIMPLSRHFFLINFKVAPSLFSYGGWIALTNIAVAILLYLDRILVGVLLTMSAVTYYTAPYELVNRALIIPSSMMMVLFPAFSTLEAMDEEKLQNLFNRALKYLILIMGLIIGIIFVFSREILLLWLGNEFAEKSTIVLQIFAIGVFFSSLAWLGGTLLQGTGNPKVVTIIHVLQVPIYILSTWLLIKAIGVEGAALSWTIRVLLSLVLLFFACWRVRLFKPIFLLQNGSLKLVVVLGVISGITIVVKSFIPFSLINILLIFSVFTILVLITMWKCVLDQEDKTFVAYTIGRFNFQKLTGGYMSAKIFLVATTIGDGNFLDNYLKAILNEKLLEEVSIIIIPDLKTPSKLFDKCEELKNRGINVLCPTVEEQDAYLDKLGNIKQIIPYNSDNRRNIGFLMALEKGCEVLISVDDDNFPRASESFFKEHLIVNQKVEMEVVNSNNGWFNICDLMDVEPKTTYPRGFPYRHRHKNPKIDSKTEEGTIHINAGLWLGHPDIDAVSCLYSPAQAKAFKGKSVLLGHNTWSPINTQNTAIARDAIAAYYFLRMGYPVMGMPIDRDGDIFSGYFVQACSRHLGYRIRVGTPVSNHIRNTHNSLKDLTHELACIWILEDITEWLQGLKLEGNTYTQTYLCLADMIEDAVEKFSGFIWNDVTRGYFHYISYCMRTWIKAVKSLEQF